MIPSGKILRQLQKDFKVSVAELSRRTKIAPASIFRAFKDVETKDSTRILLYLAITEPDLFEHFK